MIDKPRREFQKNESQITQPLRRKQIEEMSTLAGALSYVNKKAGGMLLRSCAVHPGLNGLQGVASVFILALVLACSAYTKFSEGSSETFAAKGNQSEAPTITATPSDSRFGVKEATGIMYNLSDTNSQAAQKAVEKILAKRDDRFVAVFIELLRADEIGITNGLDYRTHLAALEALSGMKFGADWPAWIEWYGTTDLVPPPGFTGWKGKLLGQIDPGFGDFLRDDLPSNIRVEEIQWGGVRVDGIPALDNAKMIPASKADYLTPGEPVFGVSINGDSRAYPLRIVDWHEMANDVVGGVPVSLAYCTLCGAGVAYDGRASNGSVYTFGSSGFLFRSNKLMYDRQTRTLWNQLTGEPVLGKLAATNVKLDLLPIVLTTWKDWLIQYPNTKVLDVNTGYSRPYVPGAAYGDYFAATDTMFPVWQRSRILPAKERVYALNLGGVAKAYPVKTLAERKIVNDVVGETSIVLIATRGVVTVEGENRRIGPVTYNAGGEVRVYNRGKQKFSPGPDADTVLDSANRPWRVTEEALIGPKNERAARINGFLAYWFGWYSFFPKTLVY